MKYIDFDLYVGQRGLNGYPLRAQSRLGQVPASGQTEPLSALDIGETALQVALADLKRGRAAQADLRALGQRLGATLFAGKIGDLLRTVRGAAAGQPDTGVRLRLRLAPAELAPVPWELLWLPDEADPLCVSGRGAITRFMDMDAPVRDLAAPRPLRLLGIIPQGSGLDIAGHKGALVDAVTAARGPDGAAIELSWLEGVVTADRIRGALQRAETHLVHFVGHGSLKDGEPQLHLNDNMGDDYPVPAATVAGFFRNRAGVRLVTLNACQGAAADSANAFMGLAPQIAAQAVPAVVAMQWDIADWAAQKFAAVFYSALCAGPEAGEVDTALTRARAALYDDAPDSRAFATPVLLLRAEGGRLWEEANKMSDDEEDSETTRPGRRRLEQSGEGGIQFGDNTQVGGDVVTGGKRVVNTGGGAHYAGPIHTEGDFVGGNKTVTQTAGGDIVGRDKITTTTTQGLDAAQLQMLLQEFGRIQQQVAARPPDPKVDKEILEYTVKKIETEAKKGAAADPGKVESLLLTLGGMADDIFQVTANALANPVLGIATAIRLIAQKAKEEKKKREGGG